MTVDLKAAQQDLCAGNCHFTVISSVKVARCHRQFRAVFVLMPVFVFVWQGRSSY